MTQALKQLSQVLTLNALTQEDPNLIEATEEQRAALACLAGSVTSQAARVGSEAFTDT